jgi:DNA-binding MarR family transcriptional regulator/GNAT superfamily N-acetyltransferase
MDYLDPRIAAGRRFTRFYTQKIGALREGLLDGPFSLTESRILYELARHDGISAAELARELGLDPGYLSRILRGFEKIGLTARSAVAEDARKGLVRLTAEGQTAFGKLDTQSSQQAAQLLSGLSVPAANRVVAAMRGIEAALGGQPSRSWLMRPLQPGDLGWVISRHGALYAQEFGWDGSFETLVAEIAVGIVRNFDPAHDGAWIAELDGMPVGSIFVVRESDAVAKLRLLLVEPAARGLHIGSRLVAEVESFARAHGYKRITLWTNSVLVAARAIYAASGYRLVASEPYHGFGRHLVGENWELELT